ncbi:winged helix DNA-binding domain-containing protein [Paenibacillus allorhizosphaerae]|uniref:Winged helix DNA-binding domain-containing protein n=1 Tax=Paenibacillus allorhizosphaerae TaxID=2849866 RepID=A0ABM8V9R6_9BACL|nr:winged helix DNA-binding domain-containing protein [Paenibacillus allorhizosphaerae]CAG7614138.1 hypothetical protein PAECIP111802_00047 [Paenibacillus allorhizosphaerae]
MANMIIAYRRLLNQRIAWAKQKEPDEVLRGLGGVQAQDYAQALWAIGLRMQDATAADIERAIVNKKIVLTWAIRGTLHFVPAEDVKWMIKLLTPRILAQDKRRLEQLEIDPQLIAQCEALIRDALEDKSRILRPNLMKLLEDAGIDTKNQRGYHLLWYLAQIGLICLGPMEGKQQTFVLLDEWVQHDKKLSVEESLQQLAKRYFTGHGPATLHDFAWWSGLTVAEARQGIEAAQKALHSEKIDGHEYWMGKDSAVETKEQSFVCLLPGYDEYLLGYKDRGAVLAAEHAPLIVPGKNGVFAPMLIVDGQISGVWKRTIKKDGVDLVIHPFTELTCTEDRIIEAARRYSEFIGLRLYQVAIHR